VNHTEFLESLMSQLPDEQVDERDLTEELATATLVLINHDEPRTSTGHTLRIEAVEEVSPSETILRGFEYGSDLEIEIVIRYPVYENQEAIASE
jgi:hypothetical protein